MAPDDTTVGRTPIELEVTQEAVDWLCTQERDASLGARPLRRTVQEAVENRLASMLVRGEVKEGDRVLVSVKAGALTVSAATDSSV